MRGSFAAALVFVVLSSLVSSPRPANGQSLLIDDFSTSQTLTFAIGAGSTASPAATTAGSDILGGERDFEVGVVAGAVVRVR